MNNVFFFSFLLTPPYMALLWVCEGLTLHRRNLKNEKLRFLTCKKGEMNVQEGYDRIDTLSKHLKVGIIFFLDFCSTFYQRARLKFEQCLVSRRILLLE